MTDNQPYDVFLSHSSADKDAVETLARRLEDEAALHPFLDKWHLIPGNPWQEELEQALDDSRTCAVFIGPGGIGPWENVEMRSALDDRVRRPGFRVVPVLLPGAVLPERGALHPGRVLQDYARSPPWTTRCPTPLSRAHSAAYLGMVPSGTTQALRTRASFHCYLILRPHMLCAKDTPPTTLPACTGVTVAYRLHSIRCMSICPGALCVQYPGHANEVSND